MWWFLKILQSYGWFIIKQKGIWDGLGVPWYPCFEKHPCQCYVDSGNSRFGVFTRMDASNANTSDDSNIDTQYAIVECIDIKSNVN